MSEVPSTEVTGKKKQQQEEAYLEINCRMYKAEYPQCKITEVFEDGYYVEFLEYDKLCGMLLSSEISRKRANYVKRLVKVGSEEILRVLRVDSQKGFFDLSKKSVKEEEKVEFKEKFVQSKNVHAIMKLLAFKTQVPILELYEQFCWQLYSEYGHAIVAFKQALNDEDEVFKNTDIKPEIKKALMDILKVRMIPQPMKLRAEFKLNCVTFEGIDAMKAALLEGEKVSNDDMAIKFRIVASPTYECSLITIKKKEGLKLIEEALKVVEKTIKEKGGTYSLTTSPHVVEEEHEKEKKEKKLNLELDE